MNKFIVILIVFTLLVGSAFAGYFTFYKDSILVVRNWLTITTQSASEAKSILESRPLSSFTAYYLAHSLQYISLQDAIQIAKEALDADNESPMMKEREHLYLYVLLAKLLYATGQYSESSKYYFSALQMKEFDELIRYNYEISLFISETFQDVKDNNTLLQSYIDHELFRTDNSYSDSQEIPYSLEKIITNSQYFFNVDHTVKTDESMQW